MAKYTFKWPYAAENVIVTGSFDDWSKSVTLDKVGDSFVKSVDLPESTDKIQYKYVVDGEWKTNDQAPTEDDGKGQVNNVLTPEDLVKSAPATTALLSSAAPTSTTSALAAGAPIETKRNTTTAAPAAAILSSVTPTSTTADLAKDAPLEKKETDTASPVAGIFNSSAAPTSTTANLAKDAPLEKKATESSDIPGTFPETPFETPAQEFKVNPLPAADGAVNPIKLAPGEPVPTEFAAGSTTSHVTTDKESYEKSGSGIPGLETLESLPAKVKNMIPESSLPIVGASSADTKPTISSASPAATSAGLAAAVPVEEPKVPEVVRESQNKAGVDPEASGLSTEVAEKEKVEDELLSKVPEVPSTSEGTAGKGTDKSETDKTLFQTVTATVAGLGAAAVATVVSTKDTVTGQAATATTQATEVATDAAKQLPEPVKSVLPVSVQDAIATGNKEEVREEVAPQVPTEVKQSITEAGKSPEAAANTEAVLDKKAVESELLKEVKTVPAVAGEGSSSKAAVNGASEDKDVTPKDTTHGVKAAAPVPDTTAAKDTTTGKETAPVDATTESSAAKDTAAKDTAAAASHPAATPANPAATTTSTDADKTHPAAAASSPATATGASSSKAATDSSPAATAEKKKKNRISGFFGKLKQKMK